MITGTTCEDCGEDTAEESVCPLTYEVECEEVYVYLCDNCYEERLQHV